MAKDGEQWRTLARYLAPKPPATELLLTRFVRVQVGRVNGSDRAGDRLDSWKQITAYLKRGARTVQRWEREEGLPVHRLVHDKLGSIYAYQPELDAWWRSREAELANEPPLPAETAPSVAVLPFADMSQEKDQAYFCEGMAEEILDALSGIQGLRVSSRTASFHARTPDADTREIGRRLRVRTLLEGSVRKSGDQLRIVVQLTDAESGFHLWSGRYSREMSDIFAVQREIAENVVRALEVTLSQNERTALGKPRTADVRAYDCYLRGRRFYYQYSPQAVEFALQMFIHAMELDPSYPQAYAGLADCWSYLYLYCGRCEPVREQADWASLRAVEMDPRSGQAWASRGLSLSLSGKNDGAERAFDLAIRLAPDLFEAYYFHARHCFAMGQLEKAARLYEESMRVDPDDYQSPLLVALGKRPQGQQWAERALAIRPDDPMLLYNIGCVFCLLGRVEPAIECLEKAARNGLTHRGWYGHDSNLDPLREHPRFQKLVGKLDR
jgi:TolB-like protein/Tfp pilus assembly protein PilF